MPFDPLDHLDASLADFEHPSRPSTRSPAPHRQHPPGFPFGYPSTHSGFLKTDTEATVSEMESSTASAGGYSPPAWRRLGNGDRSSGFWRKGDNLLGYGGLPPNGYSRGGARDWDAEYDSADDDVDDEDILAAAIRTRLPTGSMSPEKERSPDPEYRRHYHPHQGARDGSHAAHDNDVRIKSEEPTMEELKATLAALPQKDDPENCTSPFSWSSLYYSFPRV